MAGHYELFKDGYSISTNPAKLDIAVIHQYLSVESYWAQNIPLHIVEKSIANSLCFGLYHNNGQIGFARLVTDKATFAYLADVFVLEPHRGKGLSKWLVQSIHAHPELQTLRRWMLGTKDAHGLYEQFGWKLLDEGAAKRFMQRHNGAVYGG
ncbi:GNAT family N-acetyltransferase [Foetidibacter luteolus]|uniref:GNAT family N-acetyltransferase n=1 Tax=Foetidibacter luteolus TaxID=2608880 RepID=UPI00129A3E74|nr:GNAT family N-acetyltransferase [Foetidibacter luteolus]